MSKLPSNNKIIKFQNSLLNWFGEHGRSFRWRSEGLNSYQLIIAETLLQRTRAETIASFYPRFLHRYPNWQELATAEQDSLESFLREIGLYRQRARRLIMLAKDMTSRYGVIPFDKNELKEIPFLGQYLINAIHLLIFQTASPLLDVNMARVLERYFGERKLADIRYDPYLQNLALTVVTHANSKDLNWAILDFAALVCKARKPLCEKCILNDECNYFKSKEDRKYGSVEKEY